MRRLVDDLLPWALVLLILAVLVPIGIVVVMPGYLRDKWWDGFGRHQSARRQVA